ncbi:MAG: AAA family ATPase [Deltaproteobacteria bacterium]|nr:AAA family ATPase [Deltaproteobacteria bacterium]
MDYNKERQFSYPSIQKEFLDYQLKTKLSGGDEWDVLRHKIALFEKNDALNEIADLINEEKGLVAVKRLKYYLSPDLVGYPSWSDFSRDNSVTLKFLNQFRLIASDKGNFLEKVKTQFKLIKKEGCYCSWDVWGSLLWFFNPNDFMPVKVKIFNQVAKNSPFPPFNFKADPEGLNGYLNWIETLKNATGKVKTPSGSDLFSFLCYLSRGRQDHEDKIQRDDISPFNPVVPINRVYFGPPGTGKTYRLIHEILPLYQSEESLKVGRHEIAIDIFQDSSWLVILAAAIIELGGRAMTSELCAHPFILNKLKSIGRITVAPDQITQTLSSKSLGGDSLKNSQSGNHLQLFKREDQNYWSLLDGWEELMPEIYENIEKMEYLIQKADNKAYEFITFHQSFSYEEFVEGIRPVFDQNVSKGQMRYEVCPGIFYQLCQKAVKNPSRRFAVFIDELNRGNISKIFGELITLLDTDKRLGMQNEVKVTLPYSKQEFGIPANLDVYATMNTADRSTALLDTAIRRRFDFIECVADENLIMGIDNQGRISDEEGGSIDLRLMFVNLNRRIEYLLSRDQLLGHAYFMNVRHFKDLKRVISEKIIPQLQEYFYSDWHPIQLIFRDLTDNNRNHPYPIISRRKVSEKKLFGFTLDDFEETFQYTVQEDYSSEAIKKIYDLTL